MNDPVKYIANNSVQRLLAKLVFSKYGHLLKWRSDCKDSLLDIGCGPGDVTKDLIYPTLPNNFTRLVGCDISPEMIKYAKQTVDTPKTSFIEVDIVADLTELLKSIEPFDHITSFLCLHWVQDKKLAFKNVFRLLRQSGDCFFMYAGPNPIYGAYKTLSTYPKWKNYIKASDYYHFENVQNSSNRVDQLTHELLDVGFVNPLVVCEETVLPYKSINHFREMVIPINPFLPNIPQHLHEEYMDDMMSIVNPLFIEQENGSVTLPILLLQFYETRNEVAPKVLNSICYFKDLKKVFVDLLVKLINSEVRRF